MKKKEKKLEEYKDINKEAIHAGFAERMEKLYK